MSDLGLLGGAGLGLFGSLASAGISSAVAMRNIDKTNDFNAQQAEINRDWQERMSNTSYQRAVDDLRSAGLNPMLAYMNGGATTPSGAQASGQDPSAVASALDVKDAFKQAGQQIQQEKQFDRQMDNTEEQTKIQDKQANSTVDLNSAQSSQLNATAENMRLTNQVRNTISKKYHDYARNHPGKLNPYEPAYFEMANSSFESSMVNSAMTAGKEVLKGGSKFGKEILEGGSKLLKKGGKLLSKFFGKKKK